MPVAGSTSTACCGQTCTQGVSLPQCWHITGTKAERRSGYSSPLSTLYTRIQVRPLRSVAPACGRRDVVLHGAGHHAGAAAVAAVDVDGHAVARCRIVLFWRSCRTTLARAAGPQISEMSRPAATCTTPGGTAGSSGTWTAHLPQRVCRWRRARILTLAAAGCSAARCAASRRLRFLRTAWTSAAKADAALSGPSMARRKGHQPQPDRDAGAELSPGLGAFGANPAPRRSTSRRRSEPSRNRRA